LINYPWIDTVFWSLIVTGAVITLINEAGQCLICKINNLFKVEWLSKYCNYLA
jgi:hypothetical protein